jgi:hypothetical protein
VNSSKPVPEFNLTEMTFSGSSKLSKQPENLDKFSLEPMSIRSFELEFK